MLPKAALGARILLGLIFFVFGLNGFLHFIPMPQLPEHQAAFFSAMLATKYFFPLLKGTETVCGLVLLSGMFVPLALVVLAPIIVQIAFYHTFMAPEGLPMAIAIVVLEVFLAWYHREKFRPILARK